MTVTSRRDYGWITDRIRDTAVQAVLTGIEAGLSLSAACAEVAVDLEVHANTVKNWVMQSGQLEQVRSSNDSQTFVIKNQIIYFITSCKVITYSPLKASIA